MQIWPLAAGIVAIALATLVVIAIFIKLGRSGVRGISPHHRWNRATDLKNAAEASDRANR